MAEIPNPHQEVAESLIEVAERLNASFAEDTPAYAVLGDIRSFPRPILVDFNNVIADNKIPLSLNPDAPAFLEMLKQIGNVFIVTSASDWRFDQEFMVEHDIWDPEIVLMTARNFRFLSDENDVEGKKLRTAFLEKLKDKRLTETDLATPFTSKPVAPIFGKDFDIPLVDNADDPTHNNYGIYGIQVKEWIPEDDPYYFYYTIEAVARKNQGKPSVLEAVEIVKGYYSNI